MSSTPHPGPYKVETFPNGGTFNSRWVGMGRRGVFTTELAAKDACLELNASYLAGQASREQQWIPITKDPGFCGDFLCIVLTPQPCGNTWIRQRVVNRYYHEKWRLEEGESITHWMPLPAAPTNNSDR